MAKIKQNSETHDFNLLATKKPRKSTLEKQLKMADSILNSNQVQNIVNEFDRIKFAVNLGQYAEHVNFEILNLDETKYPYLTPYNREKRRLKDLSYKYINVNEHNIKAQEDANEPNSDYEFFDDNFYNEYNNPVREIEEEEESSDELLELSSKLGDFQIEEQNNEYDFLYKDYCINYKTCKDTVGLNDLIITHRFLIIDITGKFMASDGYLGKIHRNNVRNCLQKILDLHLITFNIDRLLEVAQIYSADVCVDIDCGTSEKVKNIISGVSSLFPIVTELHQVYKYRRTGLLLTRKKRNNGEALTLYHKGEELSYRNSTIYQNIIGRNGIELAGKTLRIECKLYKLETIRNAFNIESKEYAIVRLTDVLNSTEKPILTALQVFGAEPSKLKERIYGWIEKEPNINEGISEKSLTDVFLAERYVQLLIENNYDIIRTRNHIKSEYSGIVTEDAIKKFNAVANSRDYILNFLIYRKPKSITIILELLAKIYKYYGMEFLERGIKSD